MYKKLRIIFTIVSAVFLGLAIPAGIFLEIPGIVGCIIFAGIFFLLMLIFKQKQEKQQDQAHAPSYMTPNVPNVPDVPNTPDTRTIKSQKKEGEDCK